MILLDTSGLLAWLDSSQRLHARVAAAMESEQPPFLLSPFVLAEIDYLLATRVGTSAEQAFLSEVANGVFRLEPFESTDLEQAVAILERYEDLDLGVADASIVVLAERHRADRILTLDERHFRVVTSREGPFRLVPADS